MDANELALLEAVVLRWHDGGELALQREGEHWTGEHTLARSVLYRIAITAPLPPAQDELHRLDAIADQPPVIRVLTPERPLTLRTDGQRSGPLDFEASDDHGLGTARLHITLAQGSGEQVTVSERTLAPRGEGGATSPREAQEHDPAPAGVAAGSKAAAGSSGRAPASASSSRCNAAPSTVMQKQSVFSHSIGSVALLPSSSEVELEGAPTHRSPRSNLSR